MYPVNCQVSCVNGQVRIKRLQNAVIAGFIYILYYKHHGNEYYNFLYIPQTIYKIKYLYTQFIHPDEVGTITRRELHGHISV